MRLIALFLGVSLLLQGVSPTRGNAQALTLYIDADYSVSTASAHAIELGVRTALDEVSYRVAGTDITVAAKDHRGNVKRAFRTMQAYLADEMALALIGGMHSPPYITHREFMNENGILALLPWSAAKPVTRAMEGYENWIFRLSVDDSHSAEFLVRQSIDRHGCENVGLVLVDTGWGRTSYEALDAAFAARGRAASTVQFFPNAVSHAGAFRIAHDLDATQSDCAIMLAGTAAGAEIAKALFEVVPTIRVFSHWGIMGGGFTDLVSHDARQSLQLSVLQTCALRRERLGSPVLQRALARANPAATSLVDLWVPAAGFVHGYDLTRVLIAALEQSASDPRWADASITEKRALVRDALDDLKTPVEGILKTYDPPFQAYSVQSPDAHEALGLDDLCIARFRADGRLEDAR